MAQPEREKQLQASERFVHAEGGKPDTVNVSRLNGSRRQGTVFAFGGGKGGVGKTVLTACFGIALAQTGKQVVVVDADLGGSNLHLAMGVEIPCKTLHDFMGRRVRSLDEIVSETPIPNLRFVSGAPGAAGMADPKHWEKLKLIRHIHKLEADFILVDIGAGMSFNEIDFFLAADRGIVVANPEPPSIQEAYNFIKVCLFRRLSRLFKQDAEVAAILHRSQDPSFQRDTRLIEEIVAEVQEVKPESVEPLRQAIEAFRPKLILNMVYEPAETIEAMALQVAVNDLLGLEVDDWGHIVHDSSVQKAVRGMHPELLLPPDSPATACIHEIARKHFVAVDWEIHANPFARPPAGKQVFEQGANDNEVICSCYCELWGNCSVQNGGYPCRIKYVGFARQAGAYAKLNTKAVA